MKCLYQTRKVIGYVCTSGVSILSIQGVLNWILKPFRQYGIVFFFSQISKRKSSNIMKSLITLDINFVNKLEKKYAPALINYGQSCFVTSDFLKMACVCKTQMMPPPDQNLSPPDFSLRGHKSPTTCHFENSWWKSKSCGYAHLH